MKIVLAVLLIIIGSISVGSTIDQLGALGNGLLKAFGVVCLVAGIYFGKKNSNKK
jgi:hypothetical protein